MGKMHMSRMNLAIVLLIPTLWLYENAVVGPDIANIAMAFPDASPFLAKWAFSFTSVGVIIASLVTSILIKYIEKKKILITGLFIYSIFGLGTMLAQNMLHILIFRALTGIGGGMILPISTAIIAENFEGTKRERLFGVCQASANLSLFIVSIFGGFLLPHGWQASFWLFLFVPVVLLFALIWMPKSPPVQHDCEVAENEAACDTNVKYRMPLKIWGLMLLMALAYNMLTIDIGNMALFIIKEDFAPIWAIGLLCALPAVGKTISNFFFPESNRLLKKYFPAVVMFIYGLGFVMISSATTIWPIVIANLFLTGAAADLLSPWIYNEASKATTPTQQAAAQAIVTMGMHVGALTSAPLQEIVLYFYGTDNVRVLFQFAAAVLVISAIIATIWAARVTGNAHAAQNAV